MKRDISEMEGGAPQPLDSKRPKQQFEEDKDREVSLQSKEFFSKLYDFKTLTQLSTCQICMTDLSLGS